MLLAIIFEICKQFFEWKLLVNPTPYILNKAKCFFFRHNHFFQDHFFLWFTSIVLCGTNAFFKSKYIPCIKMHAWKCCLKSFWWHTGISDVSVTLMLSTFSYFMRTTPKSKDHDIKLTRSCALTVCFVLAGTATALTSTISKSAQKRTQRIFKSHTQLPLFYLPLWVCVSSINSWARKYFHRTNRIQTRAHPCWRQMCPRASGQTDSRECFSWMCLDFI